LRFAPNEGLPGQALAAAVPVWHDDLEAADGFVRSQPARAAGLRSAVCLPLVSNGRATGVVECFTREAQPVDDDLRDMLMTVASQVGEHLERLRAQERLEAAQQRFAAELERSNGELEHFASVAAHDLATPLRTIAGFSDLLVRQHGDGLAPEAHEFLGLISTSAESGNRLLDSLLAYARVGAAPLRPEPVDTDAVVREVLASLSSEVVARDAEVLVAPLPVVLADRVQLAQLLQNLIANAVKFAAPGRSPVVEVTGRRDGEVAHLTVADNGIGIAPGGAERLFGMFTRGGRRHRARGRRHRARRVREDRRAPRRPDLGRAGARAGQRVPRHAARAGLAAPG
jgi:signal transduction histidine kinase